MRVRIRAIKDPVSRNRATFQRFGRKPPPSSKNLLGSTWVKFQNVKILTSRSGRMIYVTVFFLGKCHRCSMSLPIKVQSLVNSNAPRELTSPSRW